MRTLQTAGPIRRDRSHVGRRDRDPAADTPYARSKSRLRTVSTHDGELGDDEPVGSCEPGRPLWQVVARKALSLFSDLFGPEDGAIATAATAATLPVTRPEVVGSPIGAVLAKFIGQPLWRPKSMLVNGHVSDDVSSTGPMRPQLSADPPCCVVHDTDGIRESATDGDIFPGQPGITSDSLKAVNGYLGMRHDSEAVEQDEIRADGNGCATYEEISLSDPRLQLDPLEWSRNTTAGIVAAWREVCRRREILQRRETEFQQLRRSSTTLNEQSAEALSGVALPIDNDDTFNYGLNRARLKYWDPVLLPMETARQCREPLNLSKIIRRHKAPSSRPETSLRSSPASSALTLCNSKQSERPPDKRRLSDASSIAREKRSKQSDKKDRRYNRNEDSKAKLHRPAPSRDVEIQVDIPTETTDKSQNTPVNQTMALAPIYNIPWERRRRPGCFSALDEDLDDLYGIDMEKFSHSADNIPTRQATFKTNWKTGMAPLAESPAVLSLRAQRESEREKDREAQLERQKMAERFNVKVQAKTEKQATETVGEKNADGSVSAPMFSFATGSKVEEGAESKEQDLQEKHPTYFEEKPSQPTSVAKQTTSDKMPSSQGTASLFPTISFGSDQAAPIGFSFNAPPKENEKSKPLNTFMGDGSTTFQTTAPLDEGTGGTIFQPNTFFASTEQILKPDASKQPEQKSMIGSSFSFPSKSQQTVDKEGPLTQKITDKPVLSTNIPSFSFNTGNNSSSTTPFGGFSFEKESNSKEESHKTVPAFSFTAPALQGNLLGKDSRVDTDKMGTTNQDKQPPITFNFGGSSKVEENVEKFTANASEAKTDGASAKPDFVFNFSKPPVEANSRHDSGVSPHIKSFTDFGTSDAKPSVSTDIAFGATKLSATGTLNTITANSAHAASTSFGGPTTQFGSSIPLTGVNNLETNKVNNPPPESEPTPAYPSLSFNHTTTNTSSSNPTTNVQPVVPTFSFGTNTSTAPTFGSGNSANNTFTFGSSSAPSFGSTDTANQQQFPSNTFNPPDKISTPAPFLFGQSNATTPSLSSQPPPTQFQFGSPATTVQPFSFGVNPTTTVNNPFASGPGSTQGSGTTASIPGRKLAVPRSRKPLMRR